MTDFRRWDLLLVSHEFSDFSVKSVLLLLFFFLEHFFDFAFVELRVVVYLASLHANERVQEISILHSVGPVVDLADCDRA